MDTKGTVWQAGLPAFVSGERGLFWLTSVLALVILAFGVFSAGYTVKLVVESYCPIPFWDHWQVVETLMHADGHVRLHDLWAQHNEHRIPVGRLLCFADFFYFGGRDISLLCEIYATQVGVLLILLWTMRKLAGLSGPLLITTFGFACYCCLSPLAEQNFTWPFQTAFVISGLGATAAFALAVSYGKNPGKANIRNLLLAGCIVSAFISECGLASGLVTWPILVVLSFALQFGIVHKLILAVSATAAIAAYVIGYQTPEMHSNPLVTILQPLKLLKFVLTELAAGWDSHLPNASAWPSVAESIAFVAIAGIVVATYRSLRNKDKSALDIFLLANLWFILLALLMSALGRLRFGYGQATESRYETISLFFWACLGVKLASILSNSVGAKRILPVTQVFVLILFMSTASRYASAEQWAKDRGTYLRSGLAALEHGSWSEATPLFGSKNMVVQGYAFLRQHHWIPAPHDLIMAAVVPSAAQGVLAGYQPAAAGECEGFVDAAVDSGGGKLSVSGWTWDVRHFSVPDEIELVSSGEAITGMGKVTGSRPDVLAARPQTGSLKTGWSEDFKIKTPGKYSVFAIFKQENIGCPLNGQLVVSFKPAQ